MTLQSRIIHVFDQIPEDRIRIRKGAEGGLEGRAHQDRGERHVDSSRGLHSTPLAVDEQLLGTAVSDDFGR